MRRIQEVIGDHNVSLKGSGKGGRGDEALFAGGGKQRDRINSRENYAEGQSGNHVGGGCGPGGWGFGTQRAGGSTENGGSGGELIVVRGDPAGEQAIHTEVA